MYVDMHMYIYTNMYKYVHKYTCVYTFVYIYIYVDVTDVDTRPPLLSIHHTRPWANSIALPNLPDRVAK